MTNAVVTINGAQQALPTVLRNNSRRGQFGVRCLQSRVDSGMMSACCSWREQSSESLGHPEAGRFVLALVQRNPR
jgi:hypothetical protein